jgi:N-acetylmuramoyl-L-alanine amidase
MSDYKVKFYVGDYGERQRQANADKADVYIEQHFNGGSATADYSMVVVGSNAGRVSKAFGIMYSKLVSEAFGTKIGAQNGILPGGFNGRGDGNIKHTNMPAVLLEPLFATNPERAEQIRSEAGQNALARCIVDCIKHFFPNGGLIGFSIGHKGKRSNPNDRGVALAGGGTEADYAEIVLKKAEALLNA